jgi:hypothetical protein
MDHPLPKNKDGPRACFKLQLTDQRSLRVLGGDKRGSGRVVGDLKLSLLPVAVNLRYSIETGWLRRRKSVEVQ